LVGQRTDGPRGEPEGRAARASASRGAPARVLLADDHDMIRRGLRRVLGTQPDMEVVGEAADGREALERARRLRPDVVLMDIRMPVMDGLEATRRLKAEMPGVCVLVVTAHEEPGYLLEAIQAGAAGYVPKNEPASRLVGAIRRALGDESPLDQEPVARLIRRLSDGVGDGRRPLVDPLTKRELEVLGLMAGGRTTQEIAEGLFISNSTARAYVRRVRVKLGASDHNQAVARAWVLGLAPVPKSGP
jgi:DNA-binding NarL/FixJ family response regulator